MPVIPAGFVFAGVAGGVDQYVNLSTGEQGQVDPTGFRVLSGARAGQLITSRADPLTDTATAFLANPNAQTVAPFKQVYGDLSQAALDEGRFGVPVDPRFKVGGTMPAVVNQAITRAVELGLMNPNPSLGAFFEITGKALPMAMLAYMGGSAFSSFTGSTGAAAPAASTAPAAPVNTSLNALHVVDVGGGAPVMGSTVAAGFPLKQSLVSAVVSTAKNAVSSAVEVVTKATAPAPKTAAEAVKVATIEKAAASVGTVAKTAGTVAAGAAAVKAASAKTEQAKATLADIGRPVAPAPLAQPAGLGGQFTNQATTQNNGSGAGLLLLALASLAFI